MTEHIYPTGGDSKLYTEEISFEDATSPDGCGVGTSNACYASVAMEDGRFMCLSAVALNAGANIIPLWERAVEQNYQLNSDEKGIMKCPNGEDVAGVAEYVAKSAKLESELPKDEAWEKALENIPEK